MQLLIVFAVLVALTLVFAALYNGLQKLRITADEAWADIETQLKRRYDLVPNLVETVKGYASHEKDTLERVIAARNAAASANTVAAHNQADGALSGALRGLFALAESYPDLKANQNFLGLQGTLAELEDHIQKSRRYYNAVVRDFNYKIHAIPSNIVASLFGFKEKDFFEIEDAAQRDPVKVKF